MDEVKLELYYPSVGTYRIFVPNDFIIEDDSDGILSITQPDGLSSLTVSSYSADNEIDEKICRDFFNELTEDYVAQTELIYAAGKYQLCEQQFTKGGRFWTWWLIASERQLIAASINSEEVLEPELAGLFKFIINGIEIINDDTV